MQQFAQVVEIYLGRPTRVDKIVPSLFVVVGSNWLIENRPRIGGKDCCGYPLSSKYSVNWETSGKSIDKNSFQLRKTFLVFWSILEYFGQDPKRIRK